MKDAIMPAKAKKSTAEASLRALINQTGKMRMLSHRAIMMWLLSQRDTGMADSALERFELTLTEFSKCLDGLLGCMGGDLACAEITTALNAANAVSPDQIAMLKHFKTIAEGYLKRARFKKMPNEEELQDFAEFVAGDLLSTLNDILSGVERAIKLIEQGRLDASAQNAEVIESSIEEIDKISQTVFMIAINASIEATRAGDSGHAFAALANEIRDLSKSTKASVDTLRNRLGVQS